MKKAKLKIKQVNFLDPVGPKDGGKVQFTSDKYEMYFDSELQLIEIISKELTFFVSPSRVRFIIFDE